ncbi:hypothetical protein HED60_18175 [Planctomycetales bacterium ZRK34]|nr:hypothetical protein HED60_18175 [Planctomycetales bacterium ZRK34]
MMSTSLPTLDTPGRIASKLNVPLHRVQYIIKSRKIAPVAYAGRLRLFNREAVAMIRHVINAIDAKRGVRDE